MKEEDLSFKLDSERFSIGGFLFHDISNNSLLKDIRFYKMV